MKDGRLKEMRISTNRSKALQLVERLDKLLTENGDEDEGDEGDERNTAIYVFKSLSPGDGVGSTPSTKNTEDNLRAHGLVAGHDYQWLSPFKLEISQPAIDRDLLDSIQSDGGVEIEDD